MSFIKITDQYKKERVINVNQIIKIQKVGLFKKNKYGIWLSDDSYVEVDEHDGKRIFDMIGTSL